MWFAQLPKNYIRNSNKYNQLNLLVMKKKKLVSLKNLDVKSFVLKTRTEQGGRNANAEIDIAPIGGNWTLRSECSGWPACYA